MDHDEESSVTCGEAVVNFGASYGKFHAYIVFTLCVLGLIGNVTNITVLTHRRMRSPIDTIFTALAITHLVSLVAFLPYAYVALLPWQPFEESYYWTLYKVGEFDMHVLLTLVDSWLTLSLLVWATIPVALPHKRQACTMRRAVITCLSAYVVCLPACIPWFMCFTVDAGYAVPDTDGETVDYFHDLSDIDLSNATRIYQFGLSEIATSHDFLLLTIDTWLQNVFRVVPLIALAVVTAVLMCASKRRRRDEANAFLMSAVDEDGDAVSLGGTTDTPTKLLLVMALLSLVLNLPAGILTILDGAIDTEHFTDCHVQLSQFVSMTSFIYPAATCWLYCALRREYWDTLVFIVNPRGVER